jgi:hypothetical protein
MPVVMYVSSNAPLLTSLVGDGAAMADMHPKRKASGVDARLVGWADSAFSAPWMVSLGEMQGVSHTIHNQPDQLEEKFVCSS